MERRHRAELVLLAALASIWTACFALFVREVARGGPPQTHLLVGPPESADAYPLVVGLRPGYSSTPDSVNAGDRLVRIGSADMRGAMPWSVYAHLYAEARDGTVRVEALRDAQPLDAVEHLRPEGNPWIEAFIALGFAATAMLLLWRAPGSRMVRSWAAATLMWTLTWLCFQGPSMEQTYAYLAVRTAAGCLWAPLQVRAAFHFPENAWPRDRRLPRWPWLFLVLGLTWTSTWMGIPFSHQLGARANPGIGSLVVVAVLLVATRSYRWADALGRRQVRWVLLGAHLGLAPVLLGNVALMLRPDLVEWWNASQVFLVAIPISIWFAVTRSNLLDVDRLITGTAAYTIVLLACASLSAVAPWLAGEASTRAGIDPGPIELGAFVVAAACLMRLEPRLRERLERIFFAERHALQVGIDRLTAELADAPDAARLAALLGERLDALLHPASCVIYARGDQAFAPVFTRGSAVTPHLDLGSPLVAALAERAAAVDLERTPAPIPLDAADAAVLGSLAAAVLIPVTHDEALAAFIALGRKRSGDIYTSTDRALLGLVGASASASLARFSGEALLREARELQARLRQYVPASIAKRLAQGRSPEAGERVVTVLFADLRGYATLAEGRRNEDVFSLVSRYTEAVSRAVASCSGTVVEFNGDGMMAVFGAPDPLPEKERLALVAARRMVDDVLAMPLPAGERGAARLDVGVGIATGPAYVGAIRSVDRYIWSAIGNTTNLAARLQSLTRDFDAPIVIDAATRAAAGDAARDFVEHRDVSIRGLSARSDVFAMPRVRNAAA